MRPGKKNKGRWEEKLASVDNFPCKQLLGSKNLFDSTFRVVDILSLMASGKVCTKLYHKTKISTDYRTSKRFYFILSLFLHYNPNTHVS